MDGLMEEIARNSADFAVGKWGQNLPRGRQKRLWRRFYDSSLASLMTFEEVSMARAIRARAMVSEN